ncbi:hypothetical protein ON010_g11999 [Phytophthora cinnamomi]|nr:hypothetical protein ON010_g11999 [Phytophthora cinnamomi]
MAPLLTSRSHLLVTPDLIGFAWEAPIYCKIVKLGPRVVRIEGLHEAAGNMWSMKRSDAAHCTVTASEARSNTSGPLLRQAVMVEHENAFHHDQVVAASGNQVSIRLLGETLPNSANDATPVAPIVAILLEALSFGTSEWSVDEMIELHREILDRICGTSNNSGSNVVSRILADVVDPSSFPTVVGTRTWIDPKTARDLRPRPDDDDDAISEVSAGQPQLNPPSSRKRAPRNTTANRLASKLRVEFQDPGTDAEKDAQIAQLLIDRPGLTERFLQLRSDAAVQSGFADAAASPAQEAPYPAGGPRTTGDIVSVEIRVRTLGHAAAHSHTDHSSSTLVSVFLEALINSGFALFKPFPSVLARAFAIEFGIRGLSIMHFMPFTDLSDKAVWIATSGVNMQNFSAAVPLPAAPVAERIDGIIDALHSLATYAAEYFSPVLRDLVDNLVTFAKLHLRQMRWDQADLVLLVYSINAVLESFCIQMEVGTSDGSRIKLRCTEDDVGFRQILVHIQQ